MKARFRESYHAATGRLPDRPPSAAASGGGATASGFGSTESPICFYSNGLFVDNLAARPIS